MKIFHNIPVLILIVIVIVGALVLLVGLGPLKIWSHGTLQTLESERLKGAEALVGSHLSTLVPLAELYSDANSGSGYANFCKSSDAIKELKGASDAATYYNVKSDYVCNDSKTAWAATVPLSSGAYGCVDSIHWDPNSKLIIIPNSILKSTTCVLQ